MDQETPRYKNCTNSAARSWTEPGRLTNHMPGFAAVGTWIPSRLPDGSSVKSQILRWFRRPNGSHAVVAWWPGTETYPEGMLYEAPIAEFEIKAN